MPLLIVCPKCKKQLKIADTAAGKNIKCPACAAVFLAGKPAAPPAVGAAPEKPEVITPPPALKPAVVPTSSAEGGSREPSSASPSHKGVKKKPSNALLYGCLVSVVVVLLCGGAVNLGVYWLYNQGKQAWNEAWTAATSQPTTHRQANPPNRSEAEAAKAAKNDPPPAIQKLPEKVPDPAVIEAEIKAAGAGVKLVKLDLALAGLELCIDAPEGATAKEWLGEVEIKKGDRFVLKITKRAGELAEKLGKDHENKVYLHSENMVFVETNFFGSPRCVFGLNVTVGYRDYYIQSDTSDANKADCLLMIKCARTLALKKTLPADPIAALEAIKVNLGKDEAGKVTGAELDSTVSHNAVMLLKQLPQLQWLVFMNAPINDEDLAHLAGLVHLKRLGITGTHITDDGLKHLAGMTELEDLDLSAPEIKGAGLVHLAPLKKLKKMYLSGAKIDDKGLAFLQNVRSMQTLSLNLPSITGSGLAPIKNLPNLTFLMLSSCDRLSDEGLSSLSGPSRLEALVIQDAAIRGNSFRHLQDLKNLRNLDLAGCIHLSDTALEHVGKVDHLDFLWLVRTGIGDAGLAHLKGLKELRTLYLDNTKVSDAGLVHLKGLSNLKSVNLRNTKVSEKGAQELKKALPEADIEHGSE